jgi:pentatricopeptide repeat protein
MNIVPDEGTCMLVLNTAARHGLYKLADEVLRTLQSLQVPWREEHFSPLIEACARANRLKDGFAALALMRTAGVEPEPTTATPLLDAIGQDTDALDAAWGLLDEMREHGRTIDPAALDVVIQASIALGDLQRALGVYKSAGALDVLPSVRTFNTLLAGCVAAQHRPLGDQLLAEMRAAGVTADAGTYEALISLCLTQENYEDAFFYLEEMKAQGHLPPAAVYEAIVRTCASRQDTRFQIALDEMRQCRYDISLSLKNYIRDSTSGRPNDSPQEAPSITDRAQMFQESVHADAGAGAGGR